VAEILPGRIRWLTALSVTAVVALNAAGIWSIAVARRGALEQSASIFRLETAARARALESVLSATRADLVFLIGSPTFFGLPSALSSPDPREVRWRRISAEGSLLLFLRAHPEVMHLIVRSREDVPLVAAGRRGGVPVLWRPSDAASLPAPEGGRLATLVDLGSGQPEGSDVAGIAAEIDVTGLVSTLRAELGASCDCALSDAAGATLGRSGRRGTGPDPGDPGGLRAEVAIKAEGWSAPSPWTLTCIQRQAPAITLLAPLAARYRLTLILNLVVMALALLVGSFAILQARRRQLLEERAREESREREAERRLFHSERLRTVGRLAAGMAHEINNPLEGMSNYLGLASDAMDRGDTAAATRHLSAVREGLDRAAAIVRQILDHADPAKTPKTLLDLDDVVTQSVDFVRSRDEFRNVRFDLDLGSSPARLAGNQVLLGQIFLNLLLNACEAQPGGGEIAVTTRRRDGALLVEIADRGPGVTADDASRIFEPFYSTKSSTGLGLSICYSIVRQHDGEITVEPRPGGGALFRLRFPEGEPG